MTPPICLRAAGRRSSLACRCAVAVPRWPPGSLHHDRALRRGDGHLQDGRSRLADTINAALEEWIATSDPD